MEYMGNVFEYGDEVVDPPHMTSGLIPSLPEPSEVLPPEQQVVVNKLREVNTSLHESLKLRVKERQGE